MNNGLIIGGVLLALVVGSGTMYAFMSSQRTPAKTPIETVKPLATVNSSVTDKTDCKAAAVVVPLVNIATGMGMTAAVAACE